MASRTIIQLTDDTDGTPADETVTFTLDGRTYEMDLTEANAKSLRQALEPWISSARRVPNRRTPMRSESLR